MRPLATLAGRGVARLVFVTLLLAGGSAGAQQPADSSDTPTVVLLDPGIALSRSTIIFPPSFRPDERLILVPRPGPDPSFIGWRMEPKADLLSPYLLGLQREQQMSTFHSILGAVQLSAVAYVAYRHVRKFGF